MRRLIGAALAWALLLAPADVRAAEIEGVRYAVPGDRALFEADGTLRLLGRDSVTINTGGEKVFAEEVEHALKQEEGVYDAVVVGTPHERFGQCVTAIVRLRDGTAPDEAALAEAAGRHIAREPLTQAERNVIYAIRDFERFRSQFAIDLVADYWNVVQQMADLLAFLRR